MEKKPWWKKIRRSVPKKASRPMTTKKGGKGYERYPKHKKRLDQRDND